MHRILAVAAACLTACSDTAPCVRCPNVAGTYELTYGPLETPSACAAITTVSVEPSSPPLRVTVLQSQAQLSATLNMVDFAGTLYDSYDLSLSASWLVPDGGTDLAALRARFVPSTQADAGTDRLEGTWSTTILRGNTMCHGSRTVQARKL